MSFTEADYYEDDYDRPCPHCGNPFTRWRRCQWSGCEDGYISLYDEDPLYYDEDDEEMCEDCRGTGIEEWCPKCGKDPRETAGREAAVP